MLFEFKQHQFTTSEERTRFAKLLSHIIMGEEFEPWTPNKGDDYFWKLDSGNNWGLTFYHHNPERFSITYRYQCTEVRAEESLGEWLKYRLHCTPIE